VEDLRKKPHIKIIDRVICSVFSDQSFSPRVSNIHAFKNPSNLIEISLMCYLKNVPMG
jgi:hypothetical protein